MPLDFALGALAQVNNWDEIRRSRARDLQYATLLNGLQERNIQREQDTISEIQNYMNYVGKLGLMRPDVERVREVNERLINPIREGIRASNGNVRKWYMGGGRNELAKYREALLEAPEVQQGLLNTLAHQQYLADQQSGLNPLDVTYMNDGQAVEGNYLDQFNLYRQGKIDRLNYAGGYKRPDVNPQEYFSNIYNPNGDRYTQSPVELPELQRYLYLNAKQGGMNNAQARQFTKDYLRNYVQMGGNPYTYKTDDIEKVRHQRVMEDLNKARLDLQIQKMQSTVSADPYDDLFGKMELGQPVKQPVDLNSYYSIFGQQGGQPGEQSEIITSVKPLTSDTYKSNVADILGLKKTKKDDRVFYEGKIANGDRIVSYNNLVPAPGNLNDIDFTVNDINGIVTLPSPDGGGRKSYAIVNVASTASDFSKLGVYNQHWWAPNSNTSFSQGRTSNDPWMSGKMDMTMLVPIPEDEFTKRGFNYKMRNLDNPKFASQFESDDFLNEE